MVSITIWGMLAVITVIYIMISGKGINVFNKGYQEIEGSNAKAQGIFMLIVGIGILIIAFMNR